MNTDGEHMEGRLTGYDFTTPKGHYSIIDSSINPTVQKLIDYIGVLEDYIGDDHLDVWRDLNLKINVWKENDI